jgi:hypothetical protein
MRKCGRFCSIGLRLGTLNSHYSSPSNVSDLTRVSVVHTFDLIVKVWLVFIVLSLVVHDLFCRFSSTFLVVSPLFISLCISFAQVVHDEWSCLTFISFRIHHSFIVTSSSNRLSPFLFGCKINNNCVNLGLLSPFFILL